MQQSFQEVKIDPAHLIVFGLGYTGTAVARAAIAAGLSVTATSRAHHDAPPHGVRIVPFTAAADAIAQATHVLATAPPGDSGDPVLARYAQELAAAPRLHWLGYLSSTGVYGDHGGGWVDEDTPVQAGSPRTHRRVAAEQQWADLAGRRAVDIFRCAGIYGPGRSVLDDVAAGTARRVSKPGHSFGRIHVEDIAGSVLAAIAQNHAPGLRILNLADDAPAESADVIAEAARLLNLPLPPEIAYETARQTMSPMAASFWSENRKVASAQTQSLLNRTWKYPTYREGLRAIIQQRSDSPPQQ